MKARRLGYATTYGDGSGEDLSVDLVTNDDDTFEVKIKRIDHSITVYVHDGSLRFLRDALTEIVTEIEKETER